MTDFYVDSNATGANDGTSFADAFTSIYSVTGAAAGDRILVASDHSQSTGTNLILTPPAFTPDPQALVLIISVNSTTEAYEPGATLTYTNNMRFHRAVVWVGFTFNYSTNDGIFPDSSMNFPAFFVDCIINKSSTGAGATISGAGFFVFIATTFNLSQSADFWVVSSTLFLVMRRCTATGAMTGDWMTISAGTNQLVYLELDDNNFSGLSAVSGSLIEAAGGFCVGRATNNRLPSGVDLLDRGDTGIGSVLQLEGLLTDDSSSTDPLLTLRSHSTYGSMVVDESRVRSGGASDGTTPFSWRMTADAGAAPIPGILGVMSPPISVYVAGGSSVTVTIEVAHDGVGDGTSGDLTDAELWIEGMAVDSASPSFPAGGAFTTADFATPADLASSAASWSGTGVGTTQAISYTVTPAEDGYWTFRAHFAPVDQTGVSVNICPKPDVS